MRSIIRTCQSIHYKILLLSPAMKFLKLFLYCQIMAPLSVYAEWTVVTHTNIDTNTSTEVAYTANEGGYSTEIYQDSKGAVRLRFSMNKNSHRLAPDSCPTIQVDRREPHNRSINDAPCIIHKKWAEYILGYLIDEQVNSDMLRNIMNGMEIRYRFRLQNAGYAETAFSLTGSSDALKKILGEQVKIVVSSG